MTVEQDIAVVETDILRLFRSISSLNRRLADLVIDSHPDAHAADHAPGGADPIPSIEVNVQTGTTYTLQDSDDGKLVTLDNAAPIALTIPTGLRTGFACLFAGIGAGQVTASGAATLNAPDGELKNRVQHSQVSVTYMATDTYLIGGDTAA